jgi:hypothetical protein
LEFQDNSVKVNMSITLNLDKESAK